MRIMITSITSLIVLCLFGISPAQAADHWTPASEINVGKIDKLLTGFGQKETSTLHQPTVLAYKVALFLASGSADTPTQGRQQSISAKLTGGEEQFDRVSVTVEFMGYADDSLIGERFVIQLDAGKDGIWKVKKIERSAYGRGDHKK